METKRIKPTRVVAIDFGIARLGIAISDEMKIIATPFMTLQSEGKTEKTVAKLIQELTKHQEANKYEISEIVIGLPLLMSGKVGMLADEVKNFIEVMRQATQIPLVTWDERLTTVQAERSMREGGMTRKKRSKIVDKVAAVIILQNYLDHRSIRNDN